MKKFILHTIIAGGLLLFFAGCTSNSTRLGTNQPANENSSSTTQETAASSNTTASSKAATSGTVDLDKAIAIYQKQYPDTDITGIEIKTSGSATYYEVKGVDDDKEYELNINGSDGSFTVEREEMLDEDERNGIERNNEKVNLTNLLPLEKINSIAQKEGNNGTITEWSLEREQNTTYWEVTVRSSMKEVSVSIDAQSGNVLEVEIDD